MRAQDNGAASALLMNGTVGVGKTTVAEAVGDLLADAGVPHAVLDLDSLRQSWPAPPGDRFNFGVLLRNVRSIAANYLDAGAVRLVLAGVIEQPDERRRLADAVGAGLTVCRLRAEPAVLRERLTRRHEGEPEALRWHLDRSGELDAILDRSTVDDFVVDTTTGPLTGIAASVVERAGWQ
ncbi:AAA domain-containing protein [Streptomyces sp. 840.1]|uniref:AAA family ATPase n=1 Tax=Streptomyces sp. 840.1 TaxID=2485152 RepID=UPI000F49AE87|nr:AAA family ATPase [Streptomyces sp. 840.1]ROQ63653.1 AAA domain-containing protein [Streptomyces sp. 840.1]